MKLVTVILILTLLFTSVNISAEGKHGHHKSFKSYSSSVDKYHKSEGKFILPKEAPLDYYGQEFEDHFETNGVIYNEVIPTSLPWLYIRLTKKPNPQKFDEYVENVILLLDTRNGLIDRKARIIMVIHESTEKLLFVALDTRYTKPNLNVSGITDWEVVKDKDSSVVFKLLGATIDQIQKEKFEHIILKTKGVTI